MIYILYAFQFPISTAKSTVPDTFDPSQREIANFWTWLTDSCLIDVLDASASDGKRGTLKRVSRKQLVQMIMKDESEGKQASVERLLKAGSVEQRVHYETQKFLIPLSEDQFSSLLRLALAKGESLLKTFLDSLLDVMKGKLIELQNAAADGADLKGERLDHLSQLLESLAIRQKAEEERKAARGSSLGHYLPVATYLRDTDEKLISSVTRSLLAVHILRKDILTGTVSSYRIFHLYFDDQLEDSIGTDATDFMLVTALKGELRETLIIEVEQACVLAMDEALKQEIIYEHGKEVLKRFVNYFVIDTGEDVEGGSSDALVMSYDVLLGAFQFKFSGSGNAIVEDMSLPSELDSAHEKLKAIIDFVSSTIHEGSPEEQTDLLPRCEKLKYVMSKDSGTNISGEHFLLQSIINHCINLLKNEERMKVLSKRIAEDALKAWASIEIDLNTDLYKFIRATIQEGMWQDYVEKQIENITVEGRG